MRVKGLVLGLLIAFLGAGCGGAGGNDGIRLAQPKVSITGLATGEAATLSLDGDEQKTFTSDGRYSFSSRVGTNESYTISLVSTSGGASCLFSNGQTSIRGTNAGDETLALDCLAGGGGGGNVSASLIDPPFKIYGWAGANPVGATLAFPVTVLDENNNPLTGGGLSNFTFYEDSNEIVNSAESPLHVQPLGNNNVDFNIAIALDVSGSLSASQLATIKNAVKNFVSSRQAGTAISVFTFDSSVTQITGYTTNKSTVNTAIDGIPTDLASRDPSTDLYGAITSSAGSLTYNLLNNGSLGYAVIITDGVHTATSDGPDSTSSAVEDRLVYGLGIGGGYDSTEFQTAIGDPEGAGNTLLNASTVSEVRSARRRASSPQGCILRTTAARAATAVTTTSSWRPTPLANAPTLRVAMTPVASSGAIIRLVFRARSAPC